MKYSHVWMILKIKKIKPLINLEVFLRVNLRNQLEPLRLGEPKIEGYTWHHNPQSAPNSMQLVPNSIHSNKVVPHSGQNSLSSGNNYGRKIRCVFMMITDKYP